MFENANFVGHLLGNPFMASVDMLGTRTDKENCVLIVTDYRIPVGYRAYILNDSFPEVYAENLSAYCPQASILYGLTGVDELHQYDVIDVGSNGVIQILYNDQSSDNVLFITNQCNSNCIMCPDSEYSRKLDILGQKEHLFKLIDLVPSDAPHLTITGGEPTLLKWDFLDVLAKCKNHFESTGFLLLSNGRSFCVKEYREAFLQVIPERLQLAVPLYSHKSDKHDKITRAPQGFLQTTQALKLLQYSLDLEIRVVIMRDNFRDLPEIAELIVKEFPKTKTVSFMGIELLGNAAIRRDELWVDYIDTAGFIESAARILIASGIEARIYNYPLCGLPRRLWSLAVKSITEYKVRYKPECDQCAVKKLCGGFFFSTIQYHKINVIPVLEEYVNDKE